MKTILLTLCGVCLMSGTAAAGTVDIYQTDRNGTIAPVVGATPYQGFLATSWVFGEMSVDPQWVGQPVWTMNIRLLNPTIDPIQIGLMIGEWAADGVGGGPGTVLQMSYTNTVTYNPTSGRIFVLTGWPVPPGNFWLGYALETYGSTTTAAEVDALRVYLADAPTIGTSSSLALLGDQVGFLGSNPSISSTPVNAYLSQLIQMTVPDPPAGVPEPASCMLTGGALLLVGVYLRFSGLRKT